MKIITFNDIVNQEITPNECYEWASKVIKDKHNAYLPPKISIKPDIPGVFYNTMPSLLPNSNVAGVKLVTRYPNRTPSLDSEILLYEYSSGKNLALLDGNWITTMRTGAVAAHSIKLLAVSNFSVLGYIGLGNAARASLLVLLSLFPEKKLRIKLLKYKSQHIEFAERFKDYSNIDFTFCDTYEEVVKESDVVVSAVTYFHENICSDDCFKEGVLVVPIHTMGFTNCDLFFDKIYADDRGHVEGFKYYSRFRKFAEVSDVINHKAPGRENDRERILAYNIGISLQDIYFAKMIYELCNEKCKEVSLDAPTEKFWI